MGSEASFTHQNDMKSFKAIIESIDKVHGDIRVFRLKPVQSYAFDAGQYAYIAFNDLPPRPYSIASRPGPDVLEVHIKRGVSEASAHIMDDVKVGDTAMLSEPQGYSTYNTAKGDPVIAIASGLGIAPLKSIIEQALYDAYVAPIHLYWGTADEGEQYLRDYFEDLARTHEGFDFHVVTGGSVTEAALQAFDDLSLHHVFLSGSPAMISHAIPLLLDKKADRSKISYDKHPEAGNLKA